MCTVENFKNHPGLHRVRVCHWSAVDVFCSWFYERGLVLDTSQVQVVSDYLSLFIALLFWILRPFFFPWRRCELSNLLIVCRIYRCFQVSRYQVSWYVNQPRGLTAWCANIPLSVVLSTILTKAWLSFGLNQSSIYIQKNFTSSEIFITESPGLSFLFFFTLSLYI